MAGQAKTIVKLRAMVVGIGGGTSFKGEMIGIDAAGARRLIACGAAEMVSSPGPPDRVARMTKPIIDTGDLKGNAKMAHLRRLIRESGAEPKGTTIAALMAEAEEARR